MLALVSIFHCFIWRGGGFLLSKYMGSIKQYFDIAKNENCLVKNLNLHDIFIEVLI